MTQNFPRAIESVEAKQSQSSPIPINEKTRTKLIRRKARPAEPAGQPDSIMPAMPTKLDRIAALVSGPAGASLAELMEATGWQAHSVRGAIAGALKKRGLVVTSQMVEQVRRYRVEQKA